MQSKTTHPPLPLNSPFHRYPMVLPKNSCSQLAFHQSRARVTPNISCTEGYSVLTRMFSVGASGISRNNVNQASEKRDLAGQWFPSPLVIPSGPFSKLLLKKIDMLLIKRTTIVLSKGKCCRLWDCLRSEYVTIDAAVAHYSLQHT